MNCSIFGLAALILGLAATLVRQTPAEPQTFEVASIKPSEGDGGRVMIQMVPGGGLNVKGMGLKQLIAFAYEIPCGRDCDAFISGGPSWIDNLQFDVLEPVLAGAPGHSIGRGNYWAGITLS